MTAPVGLPRRPENPRLPITSRQLDALRLAANGLPNAALARRMGIGEATAKDLLRMAFRKLGVRDRTHAVAVAIRLGLIGLDEIPLPESLYAPVAPSAATPPGGTGPRRGPGARLTAEQPTDAPMPART
ncbi:LuxR C-terminal-related transcriptional regulator [Streptomyces sp. ME01-24h]|nr:LuxR C-terminal-related transcriptional regulator [Streptomyces sp. ME01-24h]